MSADAPVTRSERIPVRALGPFLLIAFGLAWTILGLFVFAPDPMNRIFGELTGRHPLFFLAVYAPAVAALVIVAVRAGRDGLRRFLGRLLLWRCSAAWWAFLIVGVPLVFLAGAALRGYRFDEPFPFPTTGSLLAVLISAALKGPVEEIGWRGLALPLLQRRLAPFWAATLLGAIWGLWHLPAFLLSGTQQSEWAFAPFFVGCLALSVIVTALFNASGGSILLSAVFHFAVMNPVLPDAQPHDTSILVAVAGLIVAFDRRRMFARGDAVTHVVPPPRTLAGDRKPRRDVPDRWSRAAASLIRFNTAVLVISAVYAVLWCDLRRGNISPVAIFVVGIAIVVVVAVLVAGTVGLVVAGLVVVRGGPRRPALLLGTVSLAPLVGLAILWIRGLPA